MSFFILTPYIFPNLRINLIDFEVQKGLWKTKKFHWDKVLAPVTLQKATNGDQKKLPEVLINKKISVQILLDPPEYLETDVSKIYQSWDHK